MKKISLFISFTLSILYASAQYTTSNNFEKYNLDSLELKSNGAIVKVANAYIFYQDFNLQKNDTLEILLDTRIIVADSIEIVWKGYLHINPPNQIVVTDTNNLGYNDIRIDSAKGFIRKTTFKNGGGIGLYDCSPTFDSCLFINNSNGTRGAINLFRSNSIIQNSTFTENRSSAISGGANISNAPKILNNLIFKNVTYNGNRAQINMGASGADTTIISGNKILGYYDNAGAIGLLPLGVLNVIVENNFIDSNRYGVGMLSGGINSVIKKNTITNNNIQGNPNLGGSGINFNGGNTNISVVSENLISGNLWGVTIQGTAKPNLGDNRASSFNLGQNEIYNNFNNGIEYNLFNNTPDSIYAQNNLWGRSTLIGADSTIFDFKDDSTLGVVLISPLGVMTTIKENSLEETYISVFPNPAKQQFNVKNNSNHNFTSIKIIDLLGKEFAQFDLGVAQQKQIDISKFNKGVYFIVYSDNNQRIAKKLIIN